MPIYLLATAVVLLTCLLLSKVSSKFGVPTLLVFILLGMIFGCDGPIGIRFDDYTFSEQVCTVSLIFIMFYGGFGTSWSRAKPVALKSVLLSTVGVILTAALTGLFCWYVLHFDLLESLLIGSVVSSTDAASVFSILRSKRLNLKYNTASLLELESGSNDPCANMLTVIILSFMNGENAGTHIFGMIFTQVAFAIAVGVALAYISWFALSKLRLEFDGFDSMLVFATAIASFSIAQLIGGNGYLATYLTGIILGNKPLKNKKALVNFFDGINGLMQILLFFLLGLLSIPSQLPNILLPALAIALFLTFFARPMSVFAILSPFRCPIKQQLLISWSGLRGAASIVFAIVATVSPAYTKNDVFHVVFFIVLFSILLQGSLLPFMSKRLDMIDDDSDVMKTFSDYTDEVPVQFIKLEVKKKHPWINRKIKDIHLLPDVVMAVIIRDGDHIIPRGNTVICEGDTLILSGPAAEGEYSGNLTELRIDSSHEWCSKPISEIKMDADRLIILIKRGDRIVFPRGRTMIKEKDVLIINQSL